jgi:hypothetical protein
MTRSSGKMKKIITMEVIFASQSAAEVIVLLLENQFTSFIQKEHL